MRCIFLLPNVLYTLNGTLKRKTPNWQHLKTIRSGILMLYCVWTTIYVAFSSWSKQIQCMDAHSHITQHIHSLPYLEFSKIVFYLIFHSLLFSFCFHFPLRFIFIYIMNIRKVLYKGIWRVKQKLFLNLRNQQRKWKTNLYCFSSPFPIKRVHT